MSPDAVDEPLNDAEPLPEWLNPDPSSRRRVHVCWAPNWRGAIVKLLADEGSTGWDMPFTARPGDVVLTVLGTTPPLVVLAELAGGYETDTQGADYFVAEELFPFVDATVWDEAHVGPAGGRTGSSSLLPSDAAQVLDSLAREYDAGGDWSFELGECGLESEVSSAFHVLRLWDEALNAGAGSLSHVACAECREPVDVSDVVVHRNSTGRATDLPTPSRVLELTELVCEPCHRELHTPPAGASPCPSCGASGRAREIVFGMTPGPGSQRPDVVHRGCIVDRSVTRWSCGACGETYGSRDDPSTRSEPTPGERLFDDLGDVVSSLFDVWWLGSETAWAEHAWSVLGRAGLTSYTDELGRARVICRLVALAAINREFARKARGEGDIGGWRASVSMVAHDLVGEHPAVRPFVWGQLAQAEGWPAPGADEDVPLDDLVADVAHNEHRLVADALVQGGDAVAFAELWLNAKTGTAYPLVDELVASTVNEDPPRTRWADTCGWRKGCRSEVPTEGRTRTATSVGPVWHRLVRRC